MCEKNIFVVVIENTEKKIQSKYVFTLFYLLITSKNEYTEKIFNIYFNIEIVLTYVKSAKENGGTPHIFKSPKCRRSKIEKKHSTINYFIFLNLCYALSL